VVGNELIAAPDATLVGDFRYRARLVRLPPGEGQIVSWAGQVVRGWGQQPQCLNSASLLHQTVSYECHTARHGLRGHTAQGPAGPGTSATGVAPRWPVRAGMTSSRPALKNAPRIGPSGRGGLPGRGRPSGAVLAPQFGRYVGAGGLARASRRVHARRCPSGRRRLLQGRTTAATASKRATSKTNVASPSPTCHRPTPERAAYCLTSPGPPHQGRGSRFGL
jgi:hypothetical protein